MCVHERDGYYCIQQLIQLLLLTHDFILFYELYSRFYNTILSTNRQHLMQEPIHHNKKKVQTIPFASCVVKSFQSVMSKYCQTVCSKNLDMSCPYHLISEQINHRPYYETKGTKHSFPYSNTFWLLSVLLTIPIHHHVFQNMQKLLRDGQPNNFLMDKTRKWVYGKCGLNFQKHIRYIKR